MNAILVVGILVAISMVLYLFLLVIAIVMPVYAHPEDQYHEEAEGNADDALDHHYDDRRGNGSIQSGSSVSSDWTSRHGT